MDQATRTSAARQARFKEALRAQGIAPVNVLAPLAVHDTIKELARRLREGEDLSRVLGSLHRRMVAASATVTPPALPDLVVPADLQPGPSEVAVAVRLVKHSSGGLRRWITGAGLTRDDEVGGWAGVLSRATADDLRRRVEAAGGTVVERTG